MEKKKIPTFRRKNVNKKKKAKREEKLQQSNLR